MYHDGRSIIQVERVWMDSLPQRSLCIETAKIILVHLSDAGFPEVGDYVNNSRPLLQRYKGQVKEPPSHDTRFFD